MAKKEKYNILDYIFATQHWFYRASYSTAHALFFPDTIQIVVVLLSLDSRPTTTKTPWKNMRYRIFLGLTLWATALFSQQTSFYFENIGPRDGLSHPCVTALFRDHRGYLWIGTMDGGLNRYEGHEIKVYQHDDDDTLSICNNHIINIIEDAQGYLWLGTTGGVCRFNPNTGRSKNFTSENGGVARKKEINTLTVKPTRPITSAFRRHFIH